MAERNDVVRVIAICEECGSSYAARQWPGGEIQIIGQENCSCGSADFTVAEPTDDSNIESVEDWGE